MSRIIEDVPVAEARRRLAPAYGGSWDEAAAGLLSGRFSAATVEALVDEYQRDGGFETPVLWVNDEDGVDRVLDGMHRMAAASLVNGVVGLHEGWLTDRSAPDMVHVVFELDLPHADDTDAMDMAFDLLRSFRLPGGPWVTADVMGGQGSTFEAAWYCPAANAGCLVRELIERVRRARGRLQPTAVDLALAQDLQMVGRGRDLHNGSIVGRDDGAMGKYDRLAAHLADISADEITVTMSFREISTIVGGLPPTAYRLRQWWANDSKVEARAWRSAGWHVDEGGVDFNAQTVRFARGKVGGTRARRLGLE